MLPSQNRLQKDQDFQKVYKGGKNTNTALFRIITKPSRQKQIRFGVVIANKAIKKATERNKQKRRIRSILKQELGCVEAEEGVDVVIVAKSALASAEFSEIKEQLQYGLRKAGVLSYENNHN